MTAVTLLKSVRFPERLAPEDGLFIRNLKRNCRSVAGGGFALAASLHPSPERRAWLADRRDALALVLQPCTRADVEVYVANFIFQLWRRDEEEAAFRLRVAGYHPGLVGKPRFALEVAYQRIMAGKSVTGIDVRFLPKAPELAREVDEAAREWLTELGDINAILIARAPPPPLTAEQKAARRAEKKRFVDSVWRHGRVVG